jgi:glycosyltransferase involved in cell wall biosynthesis
MPPLVLFVSKPIVPPFHDGTKCLVRDISLGLRRHRSLVMATPEVSSFGVPTPGTNPGITFAPVYGSAGSYSPTLAANARAAAWLVFRASADLWHFTFAPNPRTSEVGRVAKALRGVPVVQTVASSPRKFDARLFFGDVIVAQSRWTRDRVAEAFRVAGRRLPALEVIPPPVGFVRARSEEEHARVRRELDLTEGAPVFVYPGDLEVSRGAETVASAVRSIARALPDAVVVFACRPKTAAAPAIEADLRRRLDPRHVRFAREVDLPTLLGVSSAVLFPVDDLWGKVDIPISLLEAMRLGVPVIALDEGPLADLDGVLTVKAGDAELLAHRAVEVTRDKALREAVITAQHAAISLKYDALIVAAAYESLYDTLLG